MLLELINEFSQVVGYEINIEKSVVFLYADSELSGKEIKKSILLTIVIIKYIRINLTKERLQYEAVELVVLPGLGG
jgi:hypothetical protein